MKRLALILLCLATFAASAANYYVRPNGTTYGTSSGNSWNNAITGLNGISWGSISPGDTIWVAGGTYTGSLVPTVSGSSGGSHITVARARSDSTACTSAAGWTSTFDNQVLQTDSGFGFDINTPSYIDVTGANTASSGTNGGWKCNCPSYTGEQYILQMKDAHTVSVSYVWTKGPGHVTYSGDSRAVSATGTATSVSFTNCVFEGSTTAVLLSGATSFTFDHCQWYDCSAVNSGSWHPNGIWCAGVNGLTLRYCIFKLGPEGYGCGEGVFAEQSGGNANWKIYGCIFQDLNTSGLKAIEITSAVNGLLCYNNTFINIIVPGIWFNGGSATGTSESKNNLAYGTTLDSFGTTANNLVASSSSVFINYGTRDLHIVATTGANYPRQAGATLSSPYNLDPDGVTRGSDGTWSIGAYEYTAGGGGDVTSPTVTITTPSDDPHDSGTSSSVSISGTASDNVGVTSITYASDRGDSGTASGTTSWSFTGSLANGANNYTVTAHDAASNTGTDTVQINTDLSGGGSWSAPKIVVTGNAYIGTLK